MNNNSGDYTFGRKLEHPILGNNYYRKMDIDKIYQATPIELDSSLPVIPVYAHFVIYDLEPVKRPETPEILKHFQLDSTYEEKTRLSRYIKEVLRPSQSETTKRKSEPNIILREMKY